MDGQSTIDILSIDIDGVDYWVLSNLEILRPRVLVVEYNAVFGPKRALTVPYDPKFYRHDYHPSGLYFGASLMALQKLVAKKGYRLIAGDSSGTNAFFLDASVDAPGLPTRTPEQCWRPMKYVTDRGHEVDGCFAAIAHLPFVEV